MNKRSRYSAILAAGVLALGIAGVALATSLNPGQVGNTLGSFSHEDCNGFPLEIGAGEVGLHFVLTSAVEDSGLLDATFSNPVGSINDVPSSKKSGGTIHWYAVVTGDADTVLESASTDATGNNLNLSHTCISGAEESTPVESQPEESQPAESQPEESQPEESQPETPSFEASEAAETDTPSQPNTDTLGGTRMSGPADGAWLLVVALGVLLASVVVLTPARAKSRR